MADWDIWRKEANRFDISYELSRFDSLKTKTYRETIKNLKKSLGLSQLMYPSIYSLRRKILIPKENARQRGMFNGMNKAYTESIKLFKNADSEAWEAFETLEKLAKKIQLRQTELEKVKRIFNEKDKKKIYEEMFLTVEICFLISAWRTFLNQNNNFIKN